MAAVGVSQFWRDRPTFVTGATGLVGGWLVARLREAGALPVCLVRDSVPPYDLPDVGFNLPNRECRSVTINIWSGNRAATCWPARWASRRHSSVIPPSPA